MQYFSWQCPFQTELLFFQTKELGKRAFATRDGSGKPAFLHAYFSKTTNKTAEKITGQCFPVKSKITCKKLVHFEAKKNGLKRLVTYDICASAPSNV